MFSKLDTRLDSSVSAEITWNDLMSPGTQIVMTTIKHGRGVFGKLSAKKVTTRQSQWL